MAKKAHRQLAETYVMMMRYEEAIVEYEKLGLRTEGEDIREVLEIEKVFVNDITHRNWNESAAHSQIRDALVQSNPHARPLQAKIDDFVKHAKGIISGLDQGKEFRVSLELQILNNVKGHWNFPDGCNTAYIEDRLKAGTYDIHDALSEVEKILKNNPKNTKAHQIRLLLDSIKQWGKKIESDLCLKGGRLALLYENAIESYRQMCKLKWYGTANGWFVIHSILVWASRYDWNVDTLRAPVSHLGISKSDWSPKVHEMVKRLESIEGAERELAAANSLEAVDAALETFMEFKGKDWTVPVMWRFSQ
ncbi:hypothetical protein Hypma_003287 [Hypsizygus marmoreus]|uniref:Uncharacterized protein n=1 Tax=Hypsizygus marmoreus TaxID=39966 RepID=A0A369K2A8_HYPMA|nr:hypothetical protein Hypma_003287 [Hypsizygus marmoreus]